MTTAQRKKRCSKHSLTFLVLSWTALALANPAAMALNSIDSASQLTPATQSDKPSPGNTSPVNTVPANTSPTNTSPISTSPAKKNPIKKSGKSFSGNVSWYGPGFQGRKTASGEIFDMNKTTAAHLTLRLGTKVLVEDPKTGKSVIVKVNDRGPYVRTRVMDLAKGAARRVDIITHGVAYMNCLVLEPD